MRRVIPTLVSGLLVLVGAFVAAPADASFGLKNLDTTYTDAGGAADLRAGTHPFATTTSLGVNTTISSVTGKEVPDEQVKNLRIDLPAGFVGTPDPVPHCSAADFAAGFDLGEGKTLGTLPACADVTAVGVTQADIGFGERKAEHYPVYNLEPAPGEAARLGFVATGGIRVVIGLRVKPAPPYNVVATISGISQAAFFYEAHTTLWGNPASSAHDAERGQCGLGFDNTEKCPVSLPDKPFFTVPRSCSGPLATTFTADSWETPGAFIEPPLTAFTHDAAAPPNPLGVYGCEGLEFAAKIGSKPTTQAADSSSGLDFNLDIADEGLTSVNGIAQSDIRKAVVKLPVGVTANPSLAEGLASCSEAQYAAETLGSGPGEGCPQAAKVGNVEVETPLLEGKLLRGEVFVATPEQNPFGSLIAIYMVIRDRDLGLLVKLPGRVEPDAGTGQLVTTFGEAPYEIPQFPFSHFRFHFREGSRAPLVTPPLCGTYTTEAVFTPWSGGAQLTAKADFQIDRGVNGGSCPGAAGFAPGFEAGSANNNAGAYSPFNMRITRRDGEQEITRFSSLLPPGLTGKLAGVALCGDGAIAAAKAKNGRSELASPSCPSSSQIGRLLGGAGVGPDLTYVPGSLYLAGPYHGAPASVVAITPAVAGPFDVGTVVVREGIKIDPVTAEIEVDGSGSDPIPRILRGIPLKLRDLRVFADRPGFTLNPSNCEPFSTRATIWGSGLTAGPAARYQASNCANLGFKPKLFLRLKGATKRSGHPSLRAILQPRQGDANISRLSVALPHSEFLAQSHIRTICTRVQFNAGAGGGTSCPKGSIYGHVKAWSPLVDYMLSGPVILRSSDNPLPDLVAVVRGPDYQPIVVTQIARIDSKNGGIRNTFESFPDVPITKAILQLPAGKKSLLENSTDICKGNHRARINARAQNGRVYRFAQRLNAVGCKKTRKAKKHRRAKSRAS